MNYHKEEDISTSTPCRVGRRAATQAAHILRRFENRSAQLVGKKQQSIAVYDRSEVILGDFMGKGGFNSVYSIDQIEFNSQIHSNLSEEDCDLRKSSDIIANPDRYAIKFLSEEIIFDDEEYIRGACDLALEAKILSHLSHPNVVRLHAVSFGGTKGFSDRVEGSFFMIMEKLSCTLEDRIHKWLDRGYPVSFVRRLQIATRISSALTYLHDNRLVYRDLKPDNVCFNHAGELKIIDFGLSTVIDEHQQCPETGMYKLTFRTGAQKYMAPENYLGQPYGLSNDVFSAGMVLYELLTASFTFEAMSAEDHVFFVVKGNYRPGIPSSWPTELQKCIRTSWSENPYLRPQMKHVHRVLKKELRAQLQEQKIDDKMVHKIMELRDVRACEPILA